MSKILSCGKELMYLQNVVLGVSACSVHADWDELKLFAICKFPICQWTMPPHNLISLIHYYTMPHFDGYVAVENIVGKGEIACNKQLLLFSQCFLP